MHQSGGSYLEFEFGIVLKPAQSHIFLAHPQTQHNGHIGMADQYAAGRGVQQQTRTSHKSKYR